jgi:hypothetical protein
VLVDTAEGDLLPDDHDHAAARYLSWSTSNSASLHPCAVAVAAIDKAFTDQPSADVRRMRRGLPGSKGPSKTLAGSTGPSLRGSRPRSAPGALRACRASSEATVSHIKRSLTTVAVRVIRRLMCYAYLTADVRHMV